MLSSHSINFHIALRTNVRYFKVYIFHMQTWKAFFNGFYLQFGFATAWFYDFAGCEVVSELLLRHLEMDKR